MERYTAMIADVADSRRLDPEARTDLQKQLYESAETLNGLFGPALVKPVAFSAGDEIQGLFRSPEAEIGRAHV